MKQQITYRPSGVCASAMTITLEGETISDVSVENGCDGNSHGLAALLRGMDVEEAVRRMEGIRCGYKPTSCPDQLARAMKQWRQNADRPIK
ncbi:MAG: TIGR03905 family TSCPD domain-containing protein [Tannerellaceae bacterium]|jgi:uncharacterized protein (TIGR03905 family)|nr:TIGR03905 family TSCPD domain-containing protein [Tannerellaceae bacterium]